MDREGGGRQVTYEFTLLTDKECTEAVLRDLTFNILESVHKMYPRVYIKFILETVHKMFTSNKCFPTI